MNPHRPTFGSAVEQAAFSALGPAHPPVPRRPRRGNPDRNSAATSAGAAFDGVASRRTWFVCVPFGCRRCHHRRRRRRGRRATAMPPDRRHQRYCRMRTKRRTTTKSTSPSRTAVWHPGAGAGRESATGAKSGRECLEGLPRCGCSLSARAGHRAESSSPVHVRQSWERVQILFHVKRKKKGVIHATALPSSRGGETPKVGLTM